jgi:hypothetical protein
MVSNVIKKSYPQHTGHEISKITLHGEVLLMKVKITGINLIAKMIV